MPYTAQKGGALSKIAEVFFNVTPIVPANNTPIGPFSAFMVGAGGTIAICPLRAAAVVSLTVVAGQVYRIPIQGVDAAGTTATGIVGLG